MPYKRVTSIGDGGELLFNPDDGKSYFYVSKGTTKEILSTDSGLRPQLMPDGHVEMTQVNSSTSFNYPFDQYRNDSGFFKDGSVLIVDAANMPGEKRAVYTLYRKWYRAEPKQTKFGHKIFELRSEVIFRAPNRISFLEKSDTGTVWVQDHQGTENHGTDQLIRIDGGVHVKVPLPQGYENVQRIAQTGDIVVGTFGITKGAKPFRNFEKVGKNWKELPIPEGFVMSFVQKVFYDGTILGFVTNSDATKMVNILWKGDKVAILNNRPEWPKQGTLSLSILSNRQGLLYVEDRSTPGTAAFGYYLLKISVSHS